MPKPLMERLKDGIVLGDGGYLLALESRGYVQAGPFTPEVTIEHPNALLALHQEFIHAGCEVLQVLTFYASENKLAQVGYANKLGEINEAAVKIAREAAADKALVAGNLCMTWKYKQGAEKDKEECRNLFNDQIDLQTGPGVDFFIAETFLEVGEAIIATECIKKKSNLPAVVTMSFEGPKTRDGYTPAEAAKMLEGAGADVVGTNCWMDPAHILPVTQEMRDAVKCHIASQPVAYRCTDAVPFFTGQPGFPDKLDSYQLTRYEMGDFARRAKDMGVSYIGGCCGCQGAHMRQMARELGKMPKEERKWDTNQDAPQSATEQYKSLRESQK